MLGIELQVTAPIVCGVTKVSLVDLRNVQNLRNLVTAPSAFDRKYVHFHLQFLDVKSIVIFHVLSLRFDSSNIKMVSVTIIYYRIFNVFLTYF